MEHPINIEPSQDSTIASVPSLWSDQIPVRSVQKNWFPDYRAKHPENNASEARKNFLEQQPSNLKFLLEGRYSWMNKFIQPGDKVIEVGCGMQLSKEFIRKDFAQGDLLEARVDPLDTKMLDESFDVVICDNMLRTIPFPKKFFKEMSRILKPNGTLLIQEVNCSWFFQMLQRWKQREGWSFTQDVYSLSEACTGKNAAANCAIPNLLFDDMTEFNSHIPQFKPLFHRYSEVFTVALCGEVMDKRTAIHLPARALSWVRAIDNLLIGISPNLFALRRSVALTKR